MPRADDTLVDFLSVFAVGQHAEQLHHDDEAISKDLHTEKRILPIVCMGKGVLDTRQNIEHENHNDMIPLMPVFASQRRDSAWLYVYICTWTCASQLQYPTYPYHCHQPPHNHLFMNRLPF